MSPQLGEVSTIIPAIDKNVIPDASPEQACNIFSRHPGALAWTATRNLDFCPEKTQSGMARHSSSSQSPSRQSRRRLSGPRSSLDRQSSGKQMCQVDLLGQFIDMGTDVN
jgi:hypothetical protein